MRPFGVLIPDQALVLLVVVAGLALIVGFRRFAGTLLATVLAVALLRPFTRSLGSQLLPQLPLPVLLLFLIVGALVMLRIAMTLVIGRGAADHAVGALTADVVRWLFRLVTSPLRLIGWAFTGGRRRDKLERDRDLLE